MISESTACNILVQTPCVPGRNNFVAQLSDCSILPAAKLKAKRILDVFMTALHQVTQLPLPQSQQITYSRIIEQDQGKS